MLIEFSVANFRSIKERQTLNLVKSSGDELANNTFAANSGLELLRSAAIYGPNASGKSNILLAMQALRNTVIYSASQQHGEPLSITPFRLNTQTQQAPSEFEVSFIAQGVRYQYGFTATAERVYEEWLFAYPKKRPQRWFSRVWDATSQQSLWEFGSHLSGEKQLWQKSTRDNALFLSTAVQLNSQQLQPIYDWFKKTLKTTGVGGWNLGFSAALCEGERKSRVLEFIKAADLGISDIQLEKKPFDINHLNLPADTSAAIREDILERMKDKQLVDIKTVHENAKGEAIVFDLEDESHGTQRIFAFAGPWLDTLEKGHVLFIDELHDSLHPKLLQFLVGLFHNDATNPNNAQLIFTTHETSILNQDVLRRDQIWFCEKDQQQATQLYPLTDFSPRKGRENLELAYLSGRYGALPFVQPYTFNQE